MHPLEVYYLNQDGRGLTTPGIGLVNSAPLCIQRRHRIGKFFGLLFRWVLPLLWSGTKAVGRGRVCIDDKILTNIAERKPTYATTNGDIVSKHVKQSAQNLIGKLRSCGYKRARKLGGKKKGPMSRNINRIKHALRKLLNGTYFSHDSRGADRHG